jgi:hypothetical protein
MFVSKKKPIAVTNSKLRSSKQLDMERRMGDGKVRLG